MLVLLLYLHVLVAKKKSFLSLRGKKKEQKKKKQGKNIALDWKYGNQGLDDQNP